MRDVRALLFDVFGTVGDWRSGIAREGRRLLGAGVDAEGLADAWRGRYVPSMNRVRRGVLPWTGLDAPHRSSLDELLPEFVPGSADDATRRELVLAWHRLDPWPDCVAGLTALKDHHVVASLSNGNVSLLVDMAKHAGLPWDTVFSAELFGHYKPDLEAYLGAVRLLDLKPTQVLMVAAHRDDLAAARACGLRTAYVDRPLEHGEARAPQQDPAADLNVTSLTDLADQLRTTT